MADTEQPEQPEWVGESLAGEDENDEILVVSPDGVGGTIARRQLPAALARGFRLEAPAETDERVLERKYGDSPVLTALESAASTATFGLTDALLPTEGGAERRKRNEGAAIVGGIGGALLPWGAAGIAGKAGSAAAKALTREGAGLAGRVGARAAGTAAEGSLFGFGQGVSDLALSEEPVTAERAFKVLGSNTVLGGAIGGGFGGAGALLGEAARAGRAAVTARMAARAEQRAAVGAVADDLATLDRQGLRAARDAEVEAIAAKRLEDGRVIASEIKDAAAKPKDYFLAVDNDRTRAILARAESNVMRLGNNLEGLAQRPVRALEAYQQKSQALREFITEDALRVADDIAADHAALAARLPKFEAGGKTVAKITGSDARVYRDWKGIKATKGTRGVVVNADDVAQFRAALEAGEVASMRARGISAAKAALAESDDIITRLEGLSGKPKSERLAAIENAFDTFAERNAKAPGQEMASGLAQGAAGTLLSALGIPGMLAFPVAAKVGEAAASAFSGGIKKLFSKLSDQAAASQQSIAKALDVFVSSGARVSKAAAIKTSQSLAGARYAPPSLVEASAVGQRPSGRSRGADVDNYRARERELLAMTTRGPDGKVTMRPAGANHVFEALAPIRMVAPKAADNLAAQAQRRVEFLAGKLPPRPDRTGLQFGEDDWQPSDMELRKFARYVDAVEGGPEVIAERVSTGQLTPEDAETLREVYPETYREIQAGLIDRLSTVRRMPYAKRLMLGVLFDVATDDSLNPEFIAGMQSRFPAEEGTEGGMQAPNSKLGSVTNPAPTAAQRLST